MAWLEEQKPLLAMVTVQTIYASICLLLKFSLNQGMNENAFLTSRNIIASISLAPFAYLSHRSLLITPINYLISPVGRPTFFPSQVIINQRRKNEKRVEISARTKSFALLFLAALIGITISQKLYLIGLHLGSSSLTTAMTNLTPAITFLMSASVGMEKLEIRSLRCIAKILGTAICVGGATLMAFFRGKKLVLLFESPPDKDWLLACVVLVCNCSCWSLWIVLQVPLSGLFPDPLLVSFWTCLFASFQCLILTLVLDGNPTSWNLGSNLGIFTNLYSGVVGSAVTYYLQAWCIPRRGPLFSAVFTPLCTVITTMLAFPAVHEDLYVGSLIGAAVVIAGLYLVLWGKAGDLVTVKEGLTSSDVERDLLSSNSPAWETSSGASPSRGSN